ncbi:MAG: division/cell wall cluster transcriptional repressor MraZ [Pseudomonadales bacterium]|uniref:Transcriptional regulator MraZ n=1 Tax=Oleiphilus messinensis TaxID=141451 RepID=A0A1Y0IE29_9GAMM|nr:division/cell wall cluster transcriptional repressor MraZ [Oleiphilus messinensis]ARU58701.1 RsmH methytransferase inhibitor [Oleiphilus messinensis]MCG8612928.1 division/cell wall cluster transcriptional repressor MraZ [Pseudomonadales bacterium]
MFQGSNLINLDAKGRIAIPTKVREQLAEKCDGRIVITANTQERCLKIFTFPQWEDIMHQLNKLPAFNRAAQRTKRIMIGYASEMEIDGNGRILLSQTLREYAGLEKKVMLVGQIDSLELWSEDAWNEWLNQPCEDEIPEEMNNLIF